MALSRVVALQRFLRDPGLDAELKQAGGAKMQRGSRETENGLSNCGMPQTRLSEGRRRKTTPDQPMPYILANRGSLSGDPWVQGSALGHLSGPEISVSLTRGQWGVITFAFANQGLTPISAVGKSPWRRRTTARRGSRQWRSRGLAVAAPGFAAVRPHR